MIGTQPSKAFSSEVGFPVRVKETRQNKTPEPGSDSIRTGLWLGNAANFLWRRPDQPQISTGLMRQPYGVCTRRRTR
jgi:hypothetical protein